MKFLALAGQLCIRTALIKLCLLVLPKLAHFTDNWLLIGHVKSKGFPSHTIVVSILVGGGVTVGAGVAGAGVGGAVG